MSGALFLADAWDGHMGDWGTGWWILMVAMMVVFWGLVAVLAVWLVRSLGSGTRSGRGITAIELLDQRLARGEISPDEYRERRNALGSGPDR